MGASGWSYYTPFRTDADVALSELKAKVFEDGDYFVLGRGFKPGSISELLEHNETEGTHSILDMTGGCVSSPAKGAYANFGKAIALSDAELQQHLGTTTPTRADVERVSSELMELRSRWTGSYLTVFDESGAPSEYFFTGFSGD